MKVITIKGTEYIVFGNNESATNRNPHIENALTGETPRGEQRALLREYMIVNNIPIKDGVTTHECIRLILKNGSEQSDNVIDRNTKKKSNQHYLPLIVSNILKYDKAVYESPNYGKEAKIIHDVLNSYPKNDDINTVAMKVAVIDVTNSTHISQYKSQVSLYDIASKIVSIANFDERVENGDPTLVNIIANTGKINLFSFASKYCTYHNYEIYGNDNFSIYDGVVKNTLPHYINGISAHKIESYRLNYNYEAFNDLIGKLLDEKGIFITGRRRKVDRFMWYANRKGQE